MNGAEAKPRGIGWLYLIAALLSLIGLADSIYLTVEHLTGQSLRCTIISGCSEVLNSPYSHIGNLPLAALGAVAYFTVFDLSILAAFGYRFARPLLMALLALMFLMMMFAKLFRKAGPHEAIIVYGFRGTRVVKGRGTVIFPMVESARGLSLELMSFDVAPKQDLYTRQGVAVTVEAVAQIKVKSDQESILTAAEQFLTKTPEEREGMIRIVMEGHLRGIIGQ